MELLRGSDKYPKLNHCTQKRYPTLNMSTNRHPPLCSGLQPPLKNHLDLDIDPNTFSPDSYRHPSQIMDLAQRSQYFFIGFTQTLHIIGLTETPNAMSWGSHKFPSLLNWAHTTT